MFRLIKYQSPQYLFNQLRFSRSNRTKHLIIPRNRLSMTNMSFLYVPLYGTHYHYRLETLAVLRGSNLYVNNYFLLSMRWTYEVSCHRGG